MISTLQDILNVTKRNLIRLRRTPQLLVFSSIQPVMFLLLFNYVFGGAVGNADIGTMSYINFLLPGILAQTSIFGSMQTGIGMADDLSKGVIDRFRSLPMARSAIVAGRTVADALRNLLVILIMLGVGTLIGFRFHNGLGPGLLAIPIALLFSYAFSWISLTIGLAVKDPETAQTSGFIWVFPLVFASSVFVPTASMPAWLRVFADNQPVTQTVNAIRYLTEGIGSSSAIWYSLLWALGILAVFVPLAVWRYRKTV
jgi:ABC-2 type transport system permease protein/oleandomycin transport system permease protein